MHIHLAKSSLFESTDFSSVMIDDVGWKVTELLTNVKNVIPLYIIFHYFLLCVM